MSRSSWGLSTPAAESPVWERARCASCEVNKNWWTAHSWLDRGRAIHQCLRHCEVLDWCRRQMENNPLYVAGTVQAGVFYAGTDRVPRPAAAQPAEIPCDACARERAVASVLEVLDG